MKIAHSILAIHLLASLACASAGATAAVEITPDQLQRFGAELANPVPDRQAVLVSDSGFVVAPPASERMVLAQTTGIIEQVLVTSGTNVAIGAPLVRIGGSAIVERQHDYLGAAQEAARARMQLERDRALHEDGIISDRRLQESRDRLASARVAEQQRVLELELIGIDAAARRNLAEHGRAEPFTLLRAPRAGTVTEILVHPGERVDPDRPIARIVDLQRLWLELQVAVTDAQRLRPGMTARLPDQPEPLGEVIDVLRVVDEHSQTALVRVALRDNAPLALGAFVRAELLESYTAAAGLMRVPARALLREGDAVEVFIVADNRLERRKVQLVGESHAHTWVTGLAASDRVVVAGTAALRALHDAAVAGETP